ncbi:MAG: hypothetical protein OEY14_13310, partial [Myxococcales bacterium]|nr:hypothetical protein [Myxococcales bacterium]
TAIDTDEMVRSLQELHRSTALVVWAANLPYGRSILRALGKAKATAVALSQGDGLDPLLDMIRSRRDA